MIQPNSLPRLRLAFVDDDTLFLNALKQALGLAHDVFCMHSTRELMQFLKTGGEKLDGIFLDLEMPDTSDVHWRLGGLTAIDKIRKHFPEKTPLIAVLTGLDGAQHYGIAMENGADVLIEKTVDVNVLVADILGKLHDQIKTRAGVTR